MKRILLFSRDAGGANVVASMFNALREKGYEVLIFGKDVALSKYSHFGIKGTAITNEITAISIDSLRIYLQQNQIDFVITGTSSDDFTEKYLWKAAESLNIPSFAILDHWVNYGIRFSKYSVKQVDDYKKNKTQDYLPTKILVMDEYARQQMIKEGIDKDKVIISGQPYFDYLINKLEHLDEKLIYDYRYQKCKHQSDVLVTFVSEPISKVYGETDASEHFLGYTERTIFKEFINVLNIVALNTNRNISLIIRIHPRENEENFDDLIKLANNNINIKIDKETDELTAIAASDLLCGMTSMFLIQGAMVGKKIISMQMGLKDENKFILERLDITKSILYKEDLYSALNEGINKNNKAVNSFKVERGAINKVIELMEAVLCQF